MDWAARSKALLSPFVARRADGRDAALDAFKGIAIIGMMLVNHQPPTDHVYAPFVHALWNGWTFADTIFPAFLFAVGMSIVFALGDANGRPVPRAGVHRRIARRALLLVLISLLLVNFPYYQFDKPGLAGVLSQIAWCYLVAALLYLHTRSRTQAIVLVALLLANWAWLTLVDVPGVGRGVLTPDGASARYLDRLLFGPLAQGFETGENSPYGVLMHVSSISSTLLGLLAGRWMRTARSLGSRLAGLLVGGAALIALAALWSAALPINKLLWTSSFVLFMGGLALIVIAALYALIDILHAGAITVPLQIAGVNALFFYVFAQSVQRILVYGRFTDESGSKVRFRHYIYENWFVPIDGGKLGAMLYTLCFLALCYAVVAWLYRRRLLIKL